ncbi:DUF6271 family protein [Streptomyces sp. NPDC035033]|uniref:DUF6271 family protein n=1 Tax=Streptomyces sp. NPDC035033 TaxID=3155368 RepID=UPI0034108C7D
MHRVCLALPTDRACAATIAELGAEAAYAVRAFDGVEVHLVVLDTSGPAVLAGNRAAVDALPPVPGVTVHHLDERRQREFLHEAVRRSGVVEADRLHRLLLPDGVSYGACTDRLFLVARALGCVSVHRRDSDGRYQHHDGAPLFPVHHELATLGRRAADVAAAGLVTRSRLDPALADRRVVLAGGSFIGEMSVDLDGIRQADPEVYREVVGLWIPADCPEPWRRGLVEESFRGSRAAPFTGDLTTLTTVSPMRVDMCNIAFAEDVYARVPLPPATDTIGTDYFLTHLVHDARLPGVQHNRDIVNHYTAERRTGPGFLAYQLRFVRFLLSMRYFHALYARFRAAPDDLLDATGRVRAAAVAAHVRETLRLDRAENVHRLDVLDRSYRKLGGRYASVADALTAERGSLLDRAEEDMADFAFLIETWHPLMRAAPSAVTRLLEDPRPPSRR